jgi:hypothetical protein
MKPNYIILHLAQGSCHPDDAVTENERAFFKINSRFFFHYNTWAGRIGLFNLKSALMEVSLRVFRFSR